MNRHYILIINTLTYIKGIWPIILLISFFSVAKPAFPQTVTDNKTVKIPFFLGSSEHVSDAALLKLQTELDNAGLQHLSIKRTDFWHPYVQGIRQGQPGVYFAPPHFAAWAVKQHNFIPLIKLSGKLQFTLVSRRNDISIFEIRDVARKNICTSRAPNLDFILANSAFPESLNAPKIIFKDSPANAMLRNDKECDVFTVAEHKVKQHLIDEPYQMIRLLQSQQSINHAFISSEAVSTTTQNKLKKLIKSQQWQTLLRPLYLSYSSKPLLQNTNASEYRQVSTTYLNKLWLKAP